MKPECCLPPPQSEDDHLADDGNSWTFSIPLKEGENRTGKSSLDDGVAETNVPASLRRSFARDGFVVFGGDPPVVAQAACAALTQRLEEVLRGRYSTGRAPDKAPHLFKNEYVGSRHAVRHQHPYYDPNLSAKERRKIKKPPPERPVVGPIGFSGNRDNVKVIQVINVHKADSLYSQFARSPVLGKVVAQLAGWDAGARLAQDQVWAKPPGAAPLAFHRDSPYFMFAPDDVVTVWLALDDMDEEIGPLQYVKGSHLWGEGRVGVATQFFQSDGGISLLKSAAELHRQTSSTTSTEQQHQQQQQQQRRRAKRFLALEDLEIVSMGGLKTGCLSIHNGRTWHGSAKNSSQSRPRRGLGLHFVPANVRFTADAYHSCLWRPYVEDVLLRDGDVSQIQLPLQDFPITWQPSGGNSDGENDTVDRGQ